MIVLKTILSAGGACPYQLEATTEDGKWFYLRYRNGMLRYAVASSYVSWVKRKRDNPYDFNKQIGGELDGYAEHSEIYQHLKDLVKFPAGFQITSKESEQFDSTDLK